jgi:hypothetical protein
VALRRNMTCSPCYLANAGDCPRALACLRLLEPNLVYEAASLMLTEPPPQVAGAARGEVVDRTSIRSVSRARPRSKKRTGASA